MSEWSNENVEKLIEMYRSRPCLWKLNHEHYTNKNIKKKMFDEIVSALRDDVPGVDVNKVKTRIQNMRSVCRKEYRKVLQSEESGTSLEEVFKPSLWYYPLFEFTRDQDRPLDSISNLDPPDASDRLAVSSAAEDESYAEGGEGEGEDEGGTQQREEQVFKDPPPKRQKKGTKCTKEGIEKEVSAFLKTCTTALSVPSEPLDDCGALGTFVAQKLRKMDENQQSLAEALITKVVTKVLRKQLIENSDVVESTSSHYQAYSNYRGPQKENTNDSTGSSLADYYCLFPSGSQREPDY